ncbi:uncharacterized protein LOC130758510 [Actinidia eriantha]|uniref:uncharacterized protein LOC130758510 n=1 Tax=Actinidia eriantha TaxID=165200 RepID=UPI00258397E4|nr:uncharacterized protein LOC130758510 [Actinidia eriantha]
MASSSSPSAQRVGNILFSMDPTPFITVLSNLSSSDNALRSDAETDYDFMKKDYPNGLCLRLAHLIASSPKPTTRCLSATLLLRLLRRNGPHLSTHLTAICLTDLKSILLYHLYHETDIDTFNNLCSIISSLAIDLLPRNQWPELNLFFFRSLDSDASAQSQLAVFLIFAEAVPETWEILSIHEEGLLQACAKYMRSNMEDSRIRVAAVRASVGWIVYLRDEFTELVVLMVTTLFDLLNKNEEDYAQKVLEEMIVLAGAKTGFLKTLIDHLVESMLLVTEVEGAEDKTRELAIEFVLTVAEDRNQGCGMIEKLNKRITRLLGILIKMLVFIEDDLSWHKAGSDENNAGESDVLLYGMESLGRLAAALRGNAIVDNHPDFLPEFWADKDWRKRHAAVTALRLISEGTSKVLQEHLEKTVEKLLPLSRDPHPRVRWAVMSAIGQLSKDLAPQLQQQFHQKLVPALVAAMDDSQNPRVQAQATSAMLLFSQNCSSDILKPYLKEIVGKLIEFLQRGKKMLKEGALKALAAIASCAKEDFRLYYETVIPYLILLLKSETETSDRMLFAYSMECITMVGMAVGKEKFKDDAQQVVEVLISLQQFELETDDPLRRQLLQAWGRLCKCLGKEFLPYMTVAMPPLLQSVQLKSYLSVNTDPNYIDESNDESDDESMEEVIPTSGRLGIRTYVLEEKALACKMLCCIAAELKGGLHLWISEVARALIPLLNFRFDEEVRLAAVTAMPLLLHSTIAAMEGRLHLPGFNESPIKELPRSIIPALVKALNKESKAEVCAKVLDSLNDCMRVSGSQLKKIHVIQFVDGIIEVLEASSFKKTEREKRASAEDLGAGEWELLKEEIEQEEKVCDKVGDCLDTSIKTFKTAFLPFFDKILPFIAHMWGNDKTAKQRKIALRIFYDVAEQCREEAFRYYETCLPHLFKTCNDENPEVRQIVARGIGICAKFGGSVFKPHINVALSYLDAMIKHPNALHPDNILAYEAAVSAFGKICYFHFKGISCAHEVASAWLLHLPIRNDLQEAKDVHDQLCSMVEESIKGGFDPKDDHFLPVIRIFAEVIWAGNNLATQQTINRMIKLLKELQQKVTPTKLGSIYSSIPLHQRNMLDHIFSS